MILRKPYAILIKNFRLIHLIMAILMGYLFYKTNTLLSFFNEYINSNASIISKEVTNSTLSPILIAISIGVIIASIIIMLLMKFKDKPVKFYIYNIFTHVLLSVFYIFVYKTLRSLEIGLVDIRILKMIQDLSLVALSIQGLGVLFVIIRATGFDIKDFNFKKDLEELNIETADNEEVELQLDFDSDNLKRNLNKKMRHIKYVYIENKLLINIMIIIIIIISGILIYLNNTVYNKTYKLNESLETNRFVLSVTDSYHTKYDYKGNELKKGYELVIVSLNARTIYNNEFGLNSGSFYLDIGGYKYHHIVTYKDRIQDVGINYINQIINNKSNNYVLVFEVPSKKIKEKMNLYHVDNNKKYKIAINPVNLNKKEEKGITNLNEKISFEDTILKNTTLQIEQYEIGNEFAINYNYCIKDQCYDYIEYLTRKPSNNTNTVLLKLKGTLTLDKSIKSIKFNNLYKFINYFGKIKYKINGIEKTMTEKMVQIKPKKATTSDYYFEVSRELIDSIEIYIEFNIRNKIYLYKLR